MSRTPTAIDRLAFDAAALVREYPPRFTHPNKRIAWEVADSSGAPYEGRIEYARWRAVELPDEVPEESSFTVRCGVFEYAVPADTSTVHWHLNFADRHLFFAYGSGLLAQDELQVVEHPALASVREAVVSSGSPAVTIDELGRPTPVTVTGVQRRCVVRTQPDPEGGLPAGLYGNAFAAATEDEIRAGVRPLDPPTVTNIAAVAAPAGGFGPYRREELTYILTAAATAFAAARVESGRLPAGDGGPERAGGGGPEPADGRSPADGRLPAATHTVVHTGFWGCGAFGGDRALMTVLQALAADIAGVDVVFWALDPKGVALAEAARQMYEDLRAASVEVAELLDRLEAHGFTWGVPNGT